MKIKKHYPNVSWEEFFKDSNNKKVVINFYDSINKTLFDIPGYITTNSISVDKPIFFINDIMGIKYSGDKFSFFLGYSNDPHTQSDKRYIVNNIKLLEEESNKPDIYIEKKEQKMKTMVIKSITIEKFSSIEFDRVLDYLDRNGVFKPSAYFKDDDKTYIIENFKQKSFNQDDFKKEVEKHFLDCTLEVASNTKYGFLLKNNDSKGIIKEILLVEKE